MTPQEKIESEQIAKIEPESLPEIHEVATPPDDEPFELPSCNSEEAIALLRSWRNEPEEEAETEQSSEQLQSLPEPLPVIDEFGIPPDDEPFELPPWNPQEAIALLRHWREDESDTEDQEETFEFLRRVLDEDRFTTRKLFP